jgi:putative ABC transport system ATP-binding protein
MSEVANSIVCRQVFKTFGTGDSMVRALRGVDLEVRYGEMMALVGPSGCGKTTLISILAGLLTRDEGDLAVLGTDPSALSNHERTVWRGQNVGFIFQQFNLIPQVSILENVAVPLLLRNHPKKDALARAAKLLEEVGLKGREGTRPTKLSGGQQQRVAIARALVTGPRLLVCDEPTSALDGATGQKVMGLIRELTTAKEHVVIVVTHDERIYHFADRIAHLDDGQVTHISTPAEALAESAQRAGDAARRYNRRNAPQLSVAPTMIPSGGGALAMGMGVSGAF